MAVSISFILEKGGSGKTTSAVNLAAGLAHYNKSVLLIDLDQQANATALSGLANYKGDRYYQNHLLHLINGEKTFAECVIKTQFGYDVLPSHPDLIIGVSRLHSQYDVAFLRYLLGENLKEYHYDYVIIDSPPEKGIMPLNAAVASDYVIIPMQTDPHAMSGVKETLYGINKITEKLDLNLKVLGILPTMFYTRAAVSKQVLELASQMYPGLLIEDIIIKYTSMFKEASLMFTPLVAYNKKAFMESGYDKFTQFILEKT